MKDYKIGEWQIGKIRETLNKAKDWYYKLDMEDEEYQYLIDQSLLILEAIEKTQPFEAPVINIPSVWTYDITDTSSCAYYTSTFTGNYEE